MEHNKFETMELLTGLKAPLQPKPEKTSDLMEIKITRTCVSEVWHKDKDGNITEIERTVKEPEREVIIDDRTKETEEELEIEKKILDTKQ